MSQQVEVAVAEEVVRKTSAGQVWWSRELLRIGGLARESKHWSDFTEDSLHKMRDAVRSLADRIDTEMSRL